MVLLRLCKLEFLFKRSCGFEMCVKRKEIIFYIWLRGVLEISSFYSLICIIIILLIIGERSKMLCTMLRFQMRVEAACIHGHGTAKVYC